MTRNVLLSGFSPAAIALAAALAGCSSVGSLERDEPVVAYESAKTPLEILDCISRAWSDAGPDLDTQFRVDGYVVSLRGAWGPVGAAYITKTEAGSAVHYAEQAAGFSPHSWRQAVLACR